MFACETFDALTMNFFPFLSDPQFEYVKRCEAPARRAFRELLGLAPA